MTTDIEIKAGVELDRAVAGVIGLICTQRVLGSDVEYYVDPRDGTSAIPERFQPSTDLNAAFAAAEAVGLFDFHTIDHYCPKWQVRPVSMPEDCIPVSEGETPALAICAAILKLRATRPSR